MPARRITDVLTGDDESQNRLLHKARQLQRLQSRLQSLLPAELAAHVQIANLRGTQLVLTADGSAWASRLRYLSADLLRQLQTAGWSCQHIDVKVASRFAPPSNPKKPRSISATARHLLQQTAQHIDDPELAAALARLARHKRPPD